MAAHDDAPHVLGIPASHRIVGSVVGGALIAIAVAVTRSGASPAFAIVVGFLALAVLGITLRPDHALRLWVDAHGVRSAAGVHMRWDEVYELRRGFGRSILMARDGREVIVSDSLAHARFVVARGMHHAAVARLAEVRFPYVRTRISRRSTRVAVIALALALVIGVVGWVMDLLPLFALGTLTSLILALGLSAIARRLEVRRAEVEILLAWRPIIHRDVGTSPRIYPLELVTADGPPPIWTERERPVELFVHLVVAMAQPLPTPPPFALPASFTSQWVAQRGWRSVLVRGVIPAATTTLFALALRATRIASDPVTGHAAAGALAIVAGIVLVLAVRGRVRWAAVLTGIVGGVIVGSITSSIDLWPTATRATFGLAELGGLWTAAAVLARSNTTSRTPRAAERRTDEVISDLLQLGVSYGATLLAWQMPMPHVLWPLTLFVPWVVGGAVASPWSLHRQMAHPTVLLLVLALVTLGWASARAAAGPPWSGLVLLAGFLACQSTWRARLDALRGIGMIPVHAAMSGSLYAASLYAIANGASLWTLAAPVVTSLLVAAAISTFESAPSNGPPRVS